MRSWTSSRNAIAVGIALLLLQWIPDAQAWTSSIITRQHQQQDGQRACEPTAGAFPLQMQPPDNLMNIQSTKTSITLSSSALQAQLSSSSSSSLSPLEDWCANQVEAWYERAVAVKCPFFKRRFVDLLDAIDMTLRFLVIRHKKLGVIDLYGPPPGHRSKLLAEQDKLKFLTLEERLEAIERDWKLETHKGYYITGQLNTTLFRDDCWFDGPDPDMPVQGLRKYVNAASQLFDRRKSEAELLSLDMVSVEDDQQVVVAHWRMKGVLRLPWKPTLPEWTGSTTYYFDEEGLIYKHEEDWDMSVWQAFFETFAPDMAHKIWPDVSVAESITDAR